MFDLFIDPDMDRLGLVLEVMQGNLVDLMRTRQGKVFSENSIRIILFQLVSAIHHIHAHGYMHRDIKPENVLVSIVPLGSASSGTAAFNDASLGLAGAVQTAKTNALRYTYLIKLTDFGLCREVVSGPPYSSYISTRWYRAPEELLESPNYSYPVDIWAFGTLAYELCALQPLFPGKNQLEQLSLISSLLGTPRHWVKKNGTSVGGGSWTSGYTLAQQLNYTFPIAEPRDESCLLPKSWPESLLWIIVATLKWDPRYRVTAKAILESKFFRTTSPNAILVSNLAVLKSVSKAIQAVRSGSQAQPPSKHYSGLTSRQRPTINVPERQYSSVVTNPERDQRPDRRYSSIPSFSPVTDTNGRRYSSIPMLPPVKDTNERRYSSIPTFASTHSRTPLSLPPPSGESSPRATSVSYPSRAKKSHSRIASFFSGLTRGNNKSHKEDETRKDDNSPRLYQSAASPTPPARSSTTSLPEINMDCNFGHAIDEIDAILRSR